MPPATRSLFDEDWSALPPAVRLFVFSEATVITKSLTLAAELGIADLLADGPRSSVELAQATATHPRSLYRVLRLLCGIGVFTEVEPDRFALNPLAEYLRADVPGSMRSWLRMNGLSIWFHVFAEGHQSVRTGRPALKAVTGQEFFEYLATHPDEGEIFNLAMSDFGRWVAAAVVDAYDFAGINRVVDVGGGQGTLASAVLHKHPHMTGAVYDLPHVVESGRQRIADAGLAERCELMGGDFFQSIPAGADAYLLRWILHDWDDERAVSILRNCRRAMADDGRLLLVEAVIPPGDEPHPGKLLDFVMLTVLGGQERTEEEYAALLQEAGFRLNKVVPTASPMSIVEGLPA